MKKYRVTEKHKILKKGLLIDKKTDSLLLNQEIYFGIYPIKEWLKDGWIEEIQEPEFTKRDMVNFVAYWSEDSNNDKQTYEILDNWIKEDGKWKLK